MDQVLRPTVVFETSGMSPSTAIEAWQEIANSTLRIEIDKDERSRFSLSLQAVRLDETVATSAKTTAQAMHRDLARIHRDGLDQFGFFLQVTGSRLVQTNGIDTVLMPGDMQFVDMAQEDHVIASDGRTTTLYVPRHLVEDVVPGARQLHGTVIHNTAAQLLANQVLTLFDHDCDWTTVMAGFIERSLLSLALGCLVETRLDTAPSIQANLDRPLLRRIEHYIEDNLPDHTLDVCRIGQEYAVSRSVIYRAFQIHGGLNRYILTRRLHRIRRLLLAGDDRTVGEIAFATGFVSPAHFNREFRRAFNATPTEVRTRSWHTVPESVHASSLDRLLRSLDP